MATLEESPEAPDERRQRRAWVSESGQAGSSPQREAPDVEGPWANGPPLLGLRFSTWKTRHGVISTVPVNSDSLTLNTGDVISLSSSLFFPFFQASVLKLYKCTNG